jgi:hypothetical protein
MSSKQTIKKQFSAIQSNGDFICMNTLSGASSALTDPLGKEHLLSDDATDEAIGLALSDCLAHSRFLPYEEHKEFYDLKARRAKREEWIKAMMKEFSYRSKRALLSGMAVCNAEKFSGKIVFMPSCHVKLEAWIRRTTDDFDDVEILDTSSAAEIGKAIKVALSRCTTE